MGVCVLSTASNLANFSRQSTDNIPSVVLPSDADTAGRCRCRDTSCNVAEVAHDDRSGRVVDSGCVLSRVAPAAGGGSA